MLGNFNPLHCLFVQHICLICLHAIMQDSDVTAAGSIPAGLEDLWIRSGSRKECQWTWDMMRNTNKEVYVQ